MIKNKTRERWEAADNKTDAMRWEFMRLFRYATLFGLALWGLGVDMTGFLVVYGPLTVGVGVGEGMNIAKRVTADPEIMITEARIRNGGGVA